MRPCLHSGKMYVIKRHEGTRLSPSTPALASYSRLADGSAPLTEGKERRVGSGINRASKPLVEVASFAFHSPWPLNLLRE